MVTEFIEPDWIKFAESTHATTSFQKETPFNRDNLYTIETENAKVRFAWGTQPEVGRVPHVKRESLLQFPLTNPSISLKVYPKDFLSTLTSLFSANKAVVTYPEIDMSFLFISNSKQLIESVSTDLKTFFQSRDKFDFFITTQKNDQPPVLTIQVNELLVSEKDIYKFYTLGHTLAKRINSSV